MDINSIAKRTLPKNCVLFFKFNITTEQYNQLEKIRFKNNYSGFKDLNNFILSSDLRLAVDFMHLLNESKNSNFYLVPAYIKIDNAFITFTNFNKLLSSYTEGALEAMLIAYLNYFTFSSYIFESHTIASSGSHSLIEQIIHTIKLF